MRSNFKLASALPCLGLLFATGALAAPNAGFDVTGFIQSAFLNATPSAGVNPVMRGGTIVINGKSIIVPDNSIVQFPASSWSWAQMFDPTAWGPVYDPAIATPPATKPLPPAGTTGLALKDPLVNHFPSYEARVVGNIVTNPSTGGQVYVAGVIVPVAQQGLNAQGGYINYIDYANGRFRVGGTIGDPNTGTIAEINDPVGRYGLIHSPDQRFQADINNPTISTATGYPVCIPRVAPPANDALCPLTNRPLNGNPSFPFDPFLATGAPLKTFTMPASSAAGTTTPDPWQQVPLMVGDWVDISGTVFKIAPLGPDTPVNQYLSVHTLTAHLGIKTAPGTQPAYVRVEGLIFGVGDGAGGPTVSAGSPLTPIAQETSDRVQLVAFTTDSDPTAAKGSPVLPTGTLFGVYNDPVTGAESLEPFPNGTSANIAIDDPIRGRIRWQTSKNGGTAGVLANATGPGKFYREYVLRLSTTPATPLVAANGLTIGQYRLPIFDYIFGEGTTFGQPVPPFNFNDFGFLVNGQGPTGPGGAVIGPLKPFPKFQ
jgi:hypothetical protein